MDTNIFIKFLFFWTFNLMIIYIYTIICLCVYVIFAYINVHIHSHLFHIAVMGRFYYGFYLTLEKQSHNCLSRSHHCRTLGNCYWALHLRFILEKTWRSTQRNIVANRIMDIKHIARARHVESTQQLINIQVIKLFSSATEPLWIKWFPQAWTK